MTKRIELNEDGSQFIELKEPDELRSGDKRVAKASVKVEIDTETGNQLLPGDYQDRMKNALAAQIITNWSLNLPLPRGDVRVLDDLTLEQSDKLYKALEPYVELINDKQDDPTKKGTDPTTA